MSPLDERKVRKFDWETCKNSEPPNVAVKGSENSDLNLLTRRHAQVLVFLILAATLTFLGLTVFHLLDEENQSIRPDPAWSH